MKPTIAEIAALARVDEICNRHIAYMDEYTGRRRKKPQASKKGRGRPASAALRSDLSAAALIIDGGPVKAKLREMRSKGKRPVKSGGSVIGRPAVPVVAIYPNGRERRFNSAKEAAAELGCTRNLIQAAVTGYHGLKTAKGLQWKYAV